MASILWREQLLKSLIVSGALILILKIWTYQLPPDDPNIISRFLNTKVVNLPKVFPLSANGRGSHTAGLILLTFIQFKNSSQTLKIINQKTAPDVMCSQWL